MRIPALVLDAKNDSFHRVLLRDGVHALLYNTCKIYFIFVVRIARSFGL